MIESDRWLREHAAELGIVPECINPASVDLRLGRGLWAIHAVQQPNGEHFVTRERITLEGDQEFTMLPGVLYIAHSQERINTPITHAWMLAMKSTLARLGLDHLNAGWGDPGFQGQVTFEFTVMVPLKVHAGMRVAQLIFCRMAEVPDAAYGETGRYQEQMGPTLAREYASSRIHVYGVSEEPVSFQDDEYAADYEALSTPPSRLELGIAFCIGLILMALAITVAERLGWLAWVW